MNTKIIMIGLSFILLETLAGCTLRSTSPTSTEVYYKPSAVNYEPNPNDTDFQHNSLVGYGGINVSDYNNSF